MEFKQIHPEMITGMGQGLRDSIKPSKGVEPDAKTRASAHKVATEFEAMFAGMMLKSMRSSISPDKLTGGGRGEEIFQSMLDQEYATAIATQGSLGIAKTIENQLLEDAARKASAAQRRNPGGKP